MRWAWIDRVLELEKGKRCVTIKNVSLAEDVVHDHFPPIERADGTRTISRPVLPASLVIEGMAQTAGVLVGHAGDFKEKVVLAKITRAEFDCHAQPGHTIRFTAEITRLGSAGAATTGTLERIVSSTGQAEPMGRVDLMFSHIDQNRGGLKFPEQNFVFTHQFMDLLTLSGFPPAPASADAQA